MNVAAVIYPHQLYADHPAIPKADHVFLVEDPLFFRQYAFHRQKLILHRASMQRYAEKIPNARIIRAAELETSAGIASILKSAQCSRVRIVDPCDDWLQRRLTAACGKNNLAIEWLPDPHFLTPRAHIEEYAGRQAKLFFTDFYIEQRKRLNILVQDGKPIGGKWSFDTENRKKLPKGIVPPRLKLPSRNDAVTASRNSVNKDFDHAIGEDESFAYPTSHREAKAWLQDFLEHRFADFGQYEDAISRRETVLFHSVLTPMLNIGLISPREIVDAVLCYSDRVPMNSLEGFLRQVIGWREFVRLVYLTRSRQQRTRNHFGFTLPMPKAFYDGTTGIEPVDHVIRNVLKSGYCHHIERLMVLGSFFLLCEIQPDAVYRWFMEMFIDAYDWVMVPNVYGMSQYADGGGMTTKPYICGSRYILTMSDYPKGPWCPIWDALYWRFVDRHADEFARNPRMSMIVNMKEKLGEKMKEHRRIAEQFLSRLHS
ncbi:MAG: cryptochrome/photolyase family protein [Gemmataceae bacterium]